MRDVERVVEVEREKRRKEEEKRREERRERRVEREEERERSGERSEGERSSKPLLTRVFPLSGAILVIYKITSSIRVCTLF